MMRRVVSALLVVYIMVLKQAPAQQPARSDSLPRDTTRVYTLPPVVVTGVLVPLRQDRLGFGSSVLDRTALAAAATPYAAAVLDRLPGVWADEAAGPNGPTVLRVRGGERRHGRRGGVRGQGKERGPAGEDAVGYPSASGAVYSLLREPVGRAIGFATHREMDFALADGSTVRRPVSECHISLPQGEGHTPVVLGQPGDAEPLLGVVTLEILGLVFDPFHRTLHPMRALLV